MPFTFLQTLQQIYGVCVMRLRINLVCGYGFCLCDGSEKSWEGREFESEVADR